MGMNELRKQHRVELDEMCLAIQPNKNCEIASRAIEIALFWIYKAENQAVQIRNLEERNVRQPQRIKGRWERKESDLSWWYECSECGESPLFDPYEHEVRTPFCPWCGARMEEEEDAVD